MSRPSLYVLYYIAFLALLAGYYIFVVPLFEYTGFLWDPDYLKLAESIALLSAVLSFMPTTFVKPSDILLHLQLLMPIMAMLVLYGAAGEPRSYIYMTITAFFVVYIVVKKVRVRAVRIGNFNLVLMQRILLFISIAFIVSIIAFGGLRYLNFDVFKVYDYRSDAANNLPGVYGYISPIIGKVLLPFSLLLAVVNGDRKMAMFAICGSILLFALTSHKGPLLYPFAVLLLYYILTQKRPIYLVIVGYVAIVVLSILLYTAFDESGISFGSIFLRRLLFIPAELNFWYYDYFLSNSFGFWADSKLTFGLLRYSYTLDIPHLIGYEYLNSELAGANTGWIGFGYAQLGFAGMIIYAVILGLLLCILDSYSSIIGKRIVTAIILAPVLTAMTSSDLPTAFLTHGIVFSLILFSLFPKQNDRRGSNSIF